MPINRQNYRRPDPPEARHIISFISCPVLPELESRRPAGYKPVLATNTVGLASGTSSHMVATGF
jgi:hypothetical protein